MRSPLRQEWPSLPPRAAVRFRGESSQRQHFTIDWAPSSSNLPRRMMIFEPEMRHSTLPCLESSCIHIEVVTETNYLAAAAVYNHRFVEHLCYSIQFCEESTMSAFSSFSHIDTSNIVDRYHFFQTCSRGETN
jgi:hypothetical protein